METKKERLSDHSIENHEFIMTLDDADANAVTDIEVDFVSHVRESFEEYEQEMFLSSKQLAWLTRIAEKHYL